MNTKRILISGGSRGIGRACVELFAFRGHRVAFIYRSDDNAADEVSAKTGALAIKANVAVYDEAVSAFNCALEQLGGIDVLVNNAGISLCSLFTDTTYEQWQSIIDTNLTSAFTLSRECSREMIRKHSGSIINIGSVWGRCGASCEVAYSASKAGLRGLTQALAKELGPSGIRVNCIEPGVIDTDMNAEHSKETMDELCEETPLCRIGKPEDVAEAVYFLSSDSSSFITGQIIGVDGGFAL